jgi:membrane-associated phospholipid phosphatase
MTMYRKIVFALCACMMTQQSFAINDVRSIEGLGDVLTITLPAYALGLAYSEEGWQGMRQFVTAYGLTAIAAETTRKAVKEPRPNGLSGGGGGFPSGHTSSAFSAATFIHKRYGIRQAAVPYALATFTGYSRVQSSWHYPHQVLAGAAIGSGLTWLLVSRYENTPKILVGSDGTGATLNFRTEF